MSNAAREPIDPTAAQVCAPLAPVNTFPNFVHGPESAIMEGRRGLRYWVYQPFEMTGKKELDDSLCGYPVYLFLPPGRLAAETPVVYAAQGLSAPLQWNSFIVPLLLDLRIAVVLLDTPLGGERSIARTFRGSLAHEIVPILRQQIPFGSWFLPRVMECFAANLSFTRKLLIERHGLTDPRSAVFGVSMGVLLSSYAFIRYGFGQRLLGTIGHTDLARFADSYMQWAFYGAGNLAKAAANSRWGAKPFGITAESAPLLSAWVALMRMLDRLRQPDEFSILANPMTYAANLTDDRPIRFLLGEDDPHLNLRDTDRILRQLPNAEKYVVPGLAHGVSTFGPSFMEHVNYFLATQLGDWIR